MSDEQAEALTKWFALNDKQRGHVLNNMRVDYDDIRTDGPDDEEYPGEHAERVEAYRLAIAALGGHPGFGWVP